MTRARNRATPCLCPMVSGRRLQQTRDLPEGTRVSTFIGMENHRARGVAWLFRRLWTDARSVAHEAFALPSQKRESPSLRMGFGLPPWRQGGCIHCSSRIAISKSCSRISIPRHQPVGLSTGPRGVRTMLGRIDATTSARRIVREKVAASSNSLHCLEGCGFTNPTGTPSS